MPALQARSRHREPARRAAAGLTEVSHGALLEQQHGHVTLLLKQYRAANADTRGHAAVRRPVGVGDLLSVVKATYKAGHAAAEVAAQHAEKK